MNKERKLLQYHKLMEQIEILEERRAVVQAEADCSWENQSLWDDLEVLDAKIAALIKQASGTMIEVVR